MCGIAGIVTRDGAPPSDDALAAMTRALAHRGPDGDGRHVRAGIGMVHTRLAIIDLETGDQPFTEPGGASLIANGEIYNYRELRQEFDGAVVFATASDCEPPLHLYRRHGLDFAEKLRGMYAIAIDDAAEGRLVLARDPFGIKPLYYAETESGFAFASEPQALIAAGLVTPKVRAESRAELLQLQFTTGAETIFEGIRRVLPGETLSVVGGRIVERRRRAALPQESAENSAPPRDEDEALARLDKALEDSVLFHQRSDVPYGMFLSGGIDSSAVLALMARLNDRPVRAFTVGFPGAGVNDERAHARTVARAVGAEHVEVAFGEGDFWSLLPEIAAAVDDPVADYAILPTYRLAREAGRELKVILSGEGGDELFAGYGRYRRQARPRWLGGGRLRRRGIFDGLGVLRVGVDGPGVAGWRTGIDAAMRAASLPGRTRLQIAQATDCADWLPNDLLIKLDRCLMAHGVEGRTPFLDPAVANAAFPLADAMKLRRGMGKWLLRRWLERHLPAALPMSRKRGFTVPVGEWIAARGAALGPLVAAQPGIAEIADADAVGRLFRTNGRHAGHAAWVLLFYALWHRRHVCGLAAEGDVFDTLAAR